MQLPIHSVYTSRHADRHADRQLKCSVIALPESGKGQSNNYNHCLLCSFSFLGAVSGALCTLFCLVLTKIVWNMYHYFSDFLDDDTKTTRD